MNNKIKACHNHFWFKGGLIGLALPLILFVSFLILNSFDIAFGEHTITTLLIFSISFLEVPVVILGRMLRLPIETGRPAFIIFELNALGYILVPVFWAHLGALVGYMIDRIKKRFK